MSALVWAATEVPGTERAVAPSGATLWRLPRASFVIYLGRTVWEVERRMTRAEVEDEARRCGLLVPDEEVGP